MLELIKLSEREADMGEVPLASRHAGVLTVAWKDHQDQKHRQADEDDHDDQVDRGDSGSTVRE